MKKTIFFAGFFIFAANFFFAADEGRKFEFKYREGDNFGLISTVDETVKVNGRLNHSAKIVSRVTERVEKVDENGRGWICGNFMTSEQSHSADNNGGSWKWGENFESNFWRAKDGRFEIDSSYFMPVIRDLPVFPDKMLKTGDEWTAEGYEAEDLRRQLNVEEPFFVPFTAKYKYERDEEGFSSDSSRTKKTFAVISAKYTLFYETEMEQTKNGFTADFPVTTMGFSDRTIWWDFEKGQIDHYEENFRIVIETLTGNEYQFSGKTKVEYTEFKRTATEEAVQAVLEKIDGMGLQDISVTKTDRGLTISLENIQFEANSARLEKSEKTKIKKIGEILSSYPDNDLLVSGHTARFGSEESCQILSEQRAEAVADFLTNLGIREKKHVFTQGFGSKVPVASNSDKAGMAKNRRVEITILDK